jgi:hypothetical protein
MVPVMIMARIVGMGPKNRPEMESITDLASKTTPGISVHGVNIRTHPTPPNTIPVMILVQMFLDASFFNQKFSYSSVKESNTAALWTRPMMTVSLMLALLIFNKLNASNKLK